MFTRNLVSGTGIRQGDILQLRYRAMGIKFGTIISYDGNGNITLHFPDKQTDKPELTQKGVQHLNHAYELDDAPKFENFIFLTSQQEFTVTQAMEHVKNISLADSGQQPVIPGNWKQQIINLVKEN